MGRGFRICRRAVSIGRRLRIAGSEGFNGQIARGHPANGESIGREIVPCNALQIRSCDGLHVTVHVEQRIESANSFEVGELMCGIFGGQDIYLRMRATAALALAS